ncbi:MAG TPA: dihydrodipicolinate synthase family protein [Pirellulales bacterium]|jgi:N-acetylneuraminate lyase|nr:dihydrodipicolinate synthase family protein [Pirellulales bacterium]
MPTLLDSPNRILPALVTPLTADGKLDTVGAERLIAHLYDQGVGGLYVTGSTGEGIYLETDIRHKLVELAVAMSRGRGRVIAHVGAVEGSRALELAAHAARVGADAVASVPPFVGGYRWDEVYGYYVRLCEASKLPVVAYYIPGLTGQAFSLDSLGSLAELPNVAGFKVTDTNLYSLDRLLPRLRNDQVIYNGPDELLAFGLMLGAHGGIGTTYNFMPKAILEIAAHVAAGRHTEAVAAQKRANEAIEVLLAFPPLPATKQILYWQGLIASPACAAPRGAISEAQQQELRRRISATIVGPTLVR